MDLLFRDILLFLMALSLGASATQPTIPPKSLGERKEIEALRYQKSLQSKEVEKRLEANFSRDCLGYAYGKEDRDLLVSAVFETYPVDVLANYLKSHLEQCPYTVKEALHVIEKKSDKARATGLASHYLGQFAGFGTYSWSSHMWNIRPMLSRLGCGQKDVESFNRIYCGYSQEEDVSYLPKELEKRCPGAKVHCSQ